MKNKNLTLGYACINMELRKDKIFTNRHMRQKTFEAKGIEYASELNLLNVKDLVKIIQWNIDNGIKVYRMSSDIFTWSSEYEFNQLPDYNEICSILKHAGKLTEETLDRIRKHLKRRNKL